MKLLTEQQKIAVKTFLKKIRNFIFHNKIIYTISAYLASTMFYIYINFVKLTSRISIEAPNNYKEIQKQPLIFCFWHGRLLAPIIARRYATKASVLLSQGKDAELIAFLMKLFKVGTVRGSTGRDRQDKGGASSFKQMVKLLQQQKQSIAIAPDGPIGPRMRVAIGVAMLSLIANTRVIAVTISARPKIILNTWDKFLFLVPFSSIKVKLSSPIEPSDTSGNKKPLEDYRQEIENAMIKLTQELDKKMKTKPIMPSDVDKKNNPLKRKIN